MNYRFLIGFLVILLSLPAVSPAESSKEKEKREAAEARVSDEWLNLFYTLWTRYEDALKRGNPDKVAEQFTEPAILMEAGREDISGRDAIRKHLAELFATSRIVEISVTPGEMRICGDHIYQFGTYHQSIQTQDKPPIGQNGRYFSMWDRQEDGSWKIARVMFSSTE